MMPANDPAQCRGGGAIGGKVWGINSGRKLPCSGKCSNCNDKPIWYAGQVF